MQTASILTLDGDEFTMSIPHPVTGAEHEDIGAAIILYCTMKGGDPKGATVKANVPLTDRAKRAFEAYQIRYVEA
jgi:hypothetical protein